MDNRGRFILVKFKSIEPRDLLGIQHTMYALVLILVSCKLSSSLLFFSQSAQIQPSHTKIV